MATGRQKALSRRSKSQLALKRIMLWDQRKGSFYRGNASQLEQHRLLLMTHRPTGSQRLESNRSTQFAFEFSHCILKCIWALRPMRPFYCSSTNRKFCINFKLLLMNFRTIFCFLNSLQSLLPWFSITIHQNILRSTETFSL